MEEWALEDDMTKTIDEQIEEAREEARAIGTALEGAVMAEDMNGLNRLWTRTMARLATLEAVRDGRMVPVYATVCVNEWAKWGAHGCSGLDHREVVSASAFPGRKRHDDAVTVLRGYAHVPSTQVHEVEADSEVVL